jgi:hypothetical protein
VQDLKSITVSVRTDDGTVWSPDQVATAREAAIASVLEAFPYLRATIRPLRSAFEFEDSESGRSDGILDVDAYERGDSVDIYALDARVREALGRDSGSLALLVSPPRASRCGAVLSRYQRYLGLRNEHSRTPWFDEVLHLHDSIHDRREPLVLADYEHALDTWQWLLRLDPKAGLACQIAALFHDVERLVSESRSRIEQHARDYVEFKDAHAVRGGLMMRQLLEGSGIADSVLHHACELIVRHETPVSCGEAELLADADALSFFSLNSPGFLDYFGTAHTRRKIDYTLGRMRERARRQIDRVWLRADVRQLLAERIAERRMHGGDS